MKAIGLRNLQWAASVIPIGTGFWLLADTEFGVSWRLLAMFAGAAVVYGIGLRIRQVEAEGRE